ncbi:MAG: DNA methyltransferase, partial [Muribaculaceae bacterium]|nr:DNA methyltransferase [Muribaculaceae bacterium]
KTLLSSKDNTNVFPLYLYKENLGIEERIPNVNAKIVEQIEQSLGEKVVPEDLFDYIYAVLHSPSYRERYKEFLKIDFPRIPYPATAAQYHSLAKKGAELRCLHLMKGLPSKTGVTMPVAGSLRVDCYRWQDDRVYINSEQYFEGVPEKAWHFYIGGYQPAQKWLKDRKGMTLNFEDVKHYEQIIYVLLQTERLMNEIDKIVT